MPNMFTNSIRFLNEKKHQLQRREQATNNRIAKILSKDTPFTIAEAYKTARTNIIFTLAGKDDCKKVIFTSAEPGEGKTTTVLNMAIVFAQTGAKVLIIDGDLRKPRLHRYLHFDKKNGLSDLLIGTIKLEEAIRHDDKHNFDCIPAGQIPPNPVELLSSPAMSNLLDTVSENYDYIFIDSPPVTVVADATSMTHMVDGYIVVVRHNYTIHELLDKTRSTLLFAEGKILGYIMNDIKPLGGLSYKQYGAYSSKYSYHYRYRYGYRYGYRYNYQYGNNYRYGDDKEKSDETETVETKTVNEPKTETKNEQKNSKKSK